MIEYFNTKIEKLSSEEDLSRDTVIQSLEKAGAKVLTERGIEDAVIHRLILLEQYSRFNEDSRMIERAMQKVLSVLEKRQAGKFPRLTFSEEQRREASIASLLHDIGKSGPAQATPEQQMTIIGLFSAEDLKDPRQKVEDAIRMAFGGKADGMISTLGFAGVEPSMTMREFYDLHASWTKEILEANSDGVSERVRIIAATHHIDRGINPYDIPEEEVPMESLAIGAAEYYIEAFEKRILMAVDKYQAAVRRSGADHEKAISVVKNILGKKYANDEIMLAVLDAIDTLGASGEIFK